MARNLKIIQTKIDLLKQVIYVVERSSSKEEALEKLSRLLEELEAEYNALLIEDVRPLVFKERASR